MRTTRFLGACALAIALASCDSRDEKQDQLTAAPATQGVALSASDVAHLGIVTEEVRAARFTPQVRGYGVVLNATTLSQMDADIRSAEAAVLLSQASLERSRKLYGSHAVSAESLDAAVHQATSDQVQQSLMDRRELSMFGTDAPWRGATRDDAMLAKLASGAAAIVQATFPLDVQLGARPAALTVTHLNVQPREMTGSVSVIWRAPADPTIPGQSYYALVEASDLEQGEHVLAYAPTGAPVDGVRIPGDAIVIAEQKSWCYVLDAPGVFRRVAVDLSRPFEDGYFLSAGVTIGQRVVVKGTGLLLARELGPTGAGRY